MARKNTIFNDKKINKSRFYRNKKLFNINDIDVSKILVFKRELYGTRKSFKYFIRCVAPNNGLEEQFQIGIFFVSEVQTWYKRV